MTAPDPRPKPPERQLGSSDWVEVTQEMVQRFADVTGDHQWVHVDPVRAATGPFGGTVAHGFLTLSLAGSLLPQVLRPAPGAVHVNHGLRRVRFLTPVPVGARLRLAVAIESARPVPGGEELTLNLTFEVDGRRAPACLAVLELRVLQVGLADRAPIGA